MEMQSVKFPTECCHIVGSCYGIICLYGRKKIPSITLWNPSIRCKLIVPNVPLVNVAFGFGYDPITDDFKIVGISVEPVQTSFIYSMKKSTWSEIALPTPLPYNVKTSPCLVKGVLHWVVQNKSQQANQDAYIITFDLSSHVFGAISLPKPSWINIRLTVIKGSLAVISGYNANRWIWVRTNVSWSKPFKFTSSGIEGTDRVVQHKNHLEDSGVSYTTESYSDSSYIIDIDFGAESLELLDGETCDQPYFLWRL
uniref:F-box/kelch-repeat protein At3g23880-like n=1 Tax=Erigeron canadensis TaxID=72917 RepID=UPI001CB890E5|nr:F-box/kelch-repeat protein At3g23880-like [Erigeron canadensis]